MSYNETIIEPNHVEHPDALVMYPYPIFANTQNTGSRLQAMADIAGMPIVASDLYLQNKKTIFDMAAKEANQPSGDTYVSMSERRSDFVTGIAERLGATTFIGMGDSLAVSAIQGMQLHAETFDGLLLRDGWNLDEETTVFRGIMRYARYQIKDTVHQKHDKVSFDIPSTDYENTTAETSETNPIEKLKNIADMMRGPHNRDNAVLLAERIDLPLNVVTLKDGLSASNTTKLEMFNKSLRIARKQNHPFNKADNLMAETYPGWHSDLIDPRRGAEDLQRTLRLMKK